MLSSKKYLFAQCSTFFQVLYQKCFTVEKTECLENLKNHDQARMKIARTMFVFASVGSSTEKKSDGNPVKRMENLVRFLAWQVKGVLVDSLPLTPG